jgi:hypothetical protein
MKNTLFAIFLSLLALSDSRAESAIPPEIPLRDFFRNPETAAYQLSPSGESITFLKSVDSRMNVWIQPRAGGEAKQITHVKDRDVAGRDLDRRCQYQLALPENGQRSLEDDYHNQFQGEIHS